MLKVQVMKKFRPYDGFEIWSKSPNCYELGHHTKLESSQCYRCLSRYTNYLPCTATAGTKTNINHPFTRAKKIKKQHGTHVPFCSSEYAQMFSTNVVAAVFYFSFSLLKPSLPFSTSPCSSSTKRAAWLVLRTCNSQGVHAISPQAGPIMQPLTSQFRPAPAHTFYACLLHQLAAGLVSKMQLYHH